MAAKKKVSPTQRTLRKLRADGWTAEVVERWNPHAHIRQDLFGCIDVVALQEGKTLGIQATTAANQSARLKKMQAEPRMELWKAAGNQLQCWAWKERNNRWQVTITDA